PIQEKAYSTCEAAFIAQVPANGRACYIVAYGNPAAEAPTYETDLKAQGGDGGPLRTDFDELLIENNYYQVQIHRNSGQIHGFQSKQFGTGDNRKFGYMPDN